MSLLANVQKGKIQYPDFVVIYGVDGIGKSTFAAQAPDVIFVGPEADKGTANMDVARYPNQPKNYSEMMAAIKDLTDNPHPFKSVAVDSIDHIEPMIWNKVCEDYGVASIEAVMGGFGKGYVEANKLWRDMIGALSNLRDKRKMNVIIIAHSMVKAFNDPQTNATYDRFQLKLNEKASALWREHVDCVFFANFEVYTKQDDKKRTRAYGEGTRMMFTERRPGFDAKNRMTLPPILTLDWNEFIRAKAGANPQSAEIIVAQIQELALQIKDEGTQAKVAETLAKVGLDTARLMPVLNRVRVLVGVA